MNKRTGLKLNVVGKVFLFILLVAMLVYGAKERRATQESHERVRSALTLEMNNLKLKNESLTDTINEQERLINELNEIISEDLQAIDKEIEKLRRNCQ